MSTSASSPVPIPELDPFYDPAATGLPGDVLRFRQISVKIEPEATVWQVVYSTTGSRHQPIAVSGTIFVPLAPWAGPGPRPLVSYGVGVHGLGRNAAPSYLLRRGTEAEIPLIAMALGRGWAVAVTDGEGLGMAGPHTYGAGLSGGHSVLDIARAAMRLDAGVSADAPVLLWGYSEGGRCVAWAAELQSSYAPELNLRAAAAGGVPADLYSVAKAIDAGPFSGLGFAVLIGLAEAHQDPELDAILSEEGRAAAARAATRDVFGIIFEHPEPMRSHTICDDPWDQPAWRALLKRERNGQRKPAVPLFLYHVANDLIVPTDIGRQLYHDYTALGAEVVWLDVHADEHLAGAYVGGRKALRWLTSNLSPAGEDAVAAGVGIEPVQASADV